MLIENKPPNPRKGQPRNILTEDQKCQIVDGYLANEKYRVLAERFGVTDSCIWRVVRLSGATLDRQTISKAEIDHVWAICARERLLRPSPSTFDPMPDLSRRSIDLGAFDMVSPESAYWIGLLMADGSVSPSLVLQLSEPDDLMVHRFRDFLASDHAITIIPAGLNRQGWTQARAARIAINSRRITQVLASHGVTADKTRYGRTPTLAMHPDFWRGVIDGDGSIGPKALVATGSLPLMTQFAEFVCALYPRSRARATRHGRSSIFTVHLNGKSARLTALALYGRPGPAIERKRVRGVALYHSEVQ